MPAILNKIRCFFSADEGAVTVDWIALTAALVFMGVATAFYVGTSVPVVAGKLSAFMSGMEIDPY